MLYQYAVGSSTLGRGCVQYIELGSAGLIAPFGDVYTWPATGLCRLRPCTRALCGTLPLGLGLGVRASQAQLTKCSYVQLINNTTSTSKQAVLQTRQTASTNFT